MESDCEGSMYILLAGVQCELCYWDSVVCELSSWTITHPSLSVLRRTLRSETSRIGMNDSGFGDFGISYLTKNVN